MDIEVGRLVWWYQDGDESCAPRAAVVTGVGLGGHTLCLNIFSADMMNLVCRDGVRHVSDPLAKRESTKYEGCWDYTPRDKRLMALELQLEALLGEDKEGKGAA